MIHINPCIQTQARNCIRLEEKHAIDRFATLADEAVANSPDKTQKTECMIKGKKKHGVDTSIKIYVACWEFTNRL